MWGKNARKKTFLETHEYRDKKDEKKSSGKSVKTSFL